MLTSHKIENDVIAEINEMIGDDIDDDISLTKETSLVSVGLNSLMLARLIVNLSEKFDYDPFNEGDYAIVDIHTVGNLVSAYSQNGREV